MRSLLVIDDDELSREVLVLLATKAGFICAAAESGAAALEGLAGRAAAPDVVLTDRQMPGITGESLARLLRAACGPATVLLAMSGSQPAEEALRGFDGFLLKPFHMADLEAAIAGLSRRSAEPVTAVVLNEKVYAKLAANLQGTQLQALYSLCMDDAEKRLRSMKAAAEAQDADAFMRAAHAVKGGCGMVGATELAALAGAMEIEGVPDFDNQEPFFEFMAAIARLRRMLDARTK